MFKGAHDELFGTALVFEQRSAVQPSGAQQQQANNNPVKLAFKCKTERVLNIDRIIVKPRAANNQQQSAEQQAKASTVEEQEL